MEEEFFNLKLLAFEMVLKAGSFVIISYESLTTKPGILSLTAFNNLITNFIEPVFFFKSGFDHPEICT
jgi:hypothetical protein